MSLITRSRTSPATVAPSSDSAAPIEIRRRTSRAGGPAGAEDASDSAASAAASAAIRDPCRGGSIPETIGGEARRGQLVGVTPNTSANAPPRLHAEGPRRADHRLLEATDVTRHAEPEAVQIDDRVADDLPGPVVRGLPAALGPVDLDAAARELLVGRDHARRRRVAAERDHRRVLEQEQRVLDRARLHRRDGVELQRARLFVRHVPVEDADPNEAAAHPAARRPRTNASAAR